MTYVDVTFDTKWARHISFDNLVLSHITNRKPPLFRLHFQLTIIVENDLFDYNLFFQLLTTRVKKYKLKMKLQLKVTTTCQHHNNSHF
jgi:hypothetical protein